VTVVIRAALLPGVREWLAREPSAEHVGSLDGSCANRSYVSMIRHLRPVLAEHGACVRVNLRLPDHAHPGALEAEVEAADPGEQ
jgi:hypothetical protein